MRFYDDGVTIITLTTIILDIQPKLQLNEIAPIFSLSTTELNKIIMTIVTNTSTMTFNYDGLMS